MEDTEETPLDPQMHHKIGKSENFSEHIGLFVQRNDRDPAIKVHKILYAPFVYTDTTL